MRNRSAVGLLAALVALYGSGVVAADGPPPMPVEAEAVQRAPLEQRLSAVGSLRANEAVTIRPEISGRIDRILFEEGATVARGQVLVRLDAAVYDAELAEARAELALSRLSYQRAEDLLKRGAGSTADRDRARSEMDADQAAVQLAEARLERTVLRAPFAGALGLRTVSPGDYVLAGQDLVRLVALNPLKLDFSVPEVEAVQLGAGQQLRVQVDAYPGEQFPGVVKAVEPALDAASRALSARGQVDNPDHRLRPGMFARVELVLGRVEDALSLPEAAVVPRGSDSYVFRVLDGRVEDVKVELGLRRAGRVQVVSGLAEGDLVVTAGQLKIRDGAPVLVVAE